MKLILSLILFGVSAHAGQSTTKTIWSYTELKNYYQTVSHGSIVENPAQPVLLDIYLRPLPTLKRESLIFEVNPQTQIARSLNAVNSHSINALFVVDPLKYIAWHGGVDFVDAKKQRFKAATFNAKEFAYTKQFIHLEDWNSLDHPPVMDLGKDPELWKKDFVKTNVNSDSPFFTETFQKKIDALSDSELSFGNEIELLQNGLSFQRKMNEIKNAKSSVLMSVMSFYCDHSSEPLQDLLIQKVNEGVDVKIIVEKVWTLIAMKKCYFHLKKNGVDFVLANDLMKKKEEKALFHNKFLVIDEKLGFIGGLNVIKNDNLSTGYNQLNKDEDIEVKGPIVADLMQGFTRLYQKYTGKALTHYEQAAQKLKDDSTQAGNRGATVYASKLNDPTTRMKGACRFVIQSPSTDRHRLTEVFSEYLSQAQDRIYIKNGPYEFKTGAADEKPDAFTWSDHIFKAIFDRVDHGVKLTTLGNGVDAGSAEYTGMIRYRLKEIQSQFRPAEKLLLNTLDSVLKKNGVKANRPFLTAIQSHENAESWEHFQYLHSKIFQIDGIVSSVSSFNLETWSAEKSHESGIICMDEKLNRDVALSFLRDLVNSTPTYPASPVN